MKIVFMGTPQAAVPSLERLVADGHDIVGVYSQPDRPSGRGNKIIFSPIKAFALASGLRVYQPTSIRTDEAFASFASHKADVAVVVAYGRILPERFLKAPAAGAINVHFSLLPKYRGAAPVNWAIANGEAETGVTTMQMDAGLDTGAILMQRTTKIGPRESAVDLMGRLSVLGADVLSETLKKLPEIGPTPQDHSLASQAPMMKKGDGLIDWTMTAAEISNRVRGFQPFPSAFSYFQTVRVAVWRAFSTEDDASDGQVPGEIIEAHGDDLLVSCGSGTVLKIEELQPEGKRRMAVRDFLNGVRAQRGSVFGR